MAKRQKLKAHIDIAAQGAHSIPSQYTERAKQLANRLIAGAAETNSPLESVGALALAMLLERVASGQLPPSQEFSFLKGLAEKKTPAPVQKMEVEQKIDMRVLIADAIEKNSDVMTETMKKAVVARESIRERLKLTSAMELEPLQTGGMSTSAEGEVGPSSVATPSLPPPPLEINKDAERRIRESNTPSWRKQTP